MTRELDQLAAKYGVSDEAMAQLPDRPSARWGKGAFAQVARRATARRPKRPDAIQRRRRWAASGWLPPQIAARFTTGELAVLSVIAWEHMRSGLCRLSVGAIAGLAGVSRTTAQNAARASRLLGLAAVTERRRPGRPSLTNVVAITSREWLAWLARRAKPIAFKNANPIRDQYKTREASDPLPDGRGEGKDCSQTMQVSTFAYTRSVYHTSPRGRVRSLASMSDRPSTTLPAQVVDVEE
jgi:hypothetical protein